MTPMIGKKFISVIKGAELDFWVACSLQMDAEIIGRWCIANDSGFPFRPSEVWNDGGPIIEKSGIQFRPLQLSHEDNSVVLWEAGFDDVYSYCDSSLLTSAMRQIVSLTFGNYIEY
jgi:hypothetical protein